MWGNVGCRSAAIWVLPSLIRLISLGLQVQAPDHASSAGLRKRCCLPSMPVLSLPGAAAADRLPSPRLPMRAPQGVEGVMDSRWLPRDRHSGAAVSQKTGPLWVCCWEI